MARSLLFTGLHRENEARRRHEPTSAFGLNPAGHFVFAAGSASGRLASYRINSETGPLTRRGPAAHGGAGNTSRLERAKYGVSFGTALAIAIS